MSKSTFKDIDKGWKKALSAIADLKKVGVKTGLQSDAGVNNDNVSIVEYAAFNEFGTATIPARPFIASTADDKRVSWSAVMDKMVGEAVLGKVSVKYALEIVGQKMESDIKTKITTLREPKNADSTIALKGSSNPLIDTGTMRNSVRYLVEGV